jgi:hypothetical protein
LLLRGKHNDRQYGCLAAATWSSCCFCHYFGVYLRNRFCVCSPRADFVFVFEVQEPTVLATRGSRGLNESDCVSVLL